MHNQPTLRKKATCESQPAKRRRRQVRSDRDILVAPHEMDEAARLSRWGNAIGGRPKGRAEA